ncbi:MAG: UDP-N-acetylglucosamine 2-epimerase (non-hydrolyzing) [Bacteroidota bacterium]
MQTVLMCMGTRPEIIKMAPVYHALRKNDIDVEVLHTGQHTDIAWPLYEFFEIDPAFVITLERERNSVAHLAALIQDKIDQVLTAYSFDAVLVHGDTTSAYAAAQVAFYHQIPVGHVEAGLRSGDWTDPFPEEHNRRMIAQLATWHFAPTSQAAANLVDERVPFGTIFNVGNTVVDAATWSLMRFELLRGEDQPLSSYFDEVEQIARQQKLVLVTAHRRENWDLGIERVAVAVARLAAKHADLTFVWPVHPNPIVRETVERVHTSMEPEVAQRVKLIAPLDYLELLWTLQHAWLVITDSGGIQEEAASLDTPALVVRKTTERPELIASGGGALVGTMVYTIQSHVERLLRQPEHYHTMRSARCAFGDGRAADRIAFYLKRALLSGTDRPDTDQAITTAPAPLYVLAA